MGKRKHYSRTKAELPIDITIKVPGCVMEHRLKAGDEVTCRFCNSKIVLSNDTVFRYRHKYDNCVRVGCDICGQAIDAAYYVDRKNRVSMTPWDAKYVKTKMEA